MTVTKIVNGEVFELSPEELDAFMASIAPPAPTAADLVAYAADRRWRTETGGISIAAGEGVTIPVYTDDRSKLLILGVRARAEADPALVERFAAADGNRYPLDAATLIAVSDAVGAHVSACFVRFDEVAAAIDAGTVTTTAEIDAAFAEVAAPWAP